MENSINLLITKFFSQKQEIEKREEDLKECKELLRDLEGQIVMLMENEDLQSVKHDKGTVYLREDVHASIADQASLFDYLRKNNMGDVIKETIHHRTLSSMAKDIPDLPGIKVFNETRIGSRANKGGNNEH